MLRELSATSCTGALRPASIDDKRHAAKRRQSRTKNDGAVNVRPQNKESENHREATAGHRAPLDQQDEAGREQQLGNRLRPHLQRPRCHRQADHAGEKYGGTRCPATTRRNHDDRSRSDNRRNVGGKDEADAADRRERVEAKMREPLLVDPLVPGGPREQRVVMRQAVLDDLASAEQSQPTVLHELLANLERDKQSEDADGRSGQSIRLEPSRNAGIAGGAALARTTRYRRTSCYGVVSDVRAEVPRPMSFAMSV